MLWGKAAGRCEFRGCNRPLWKNPTTQEAVNISEAAHIYSFSADGPRGNADIDSNQLNEFENMLLVCHDCHKTIDQHQKKGERYSVELLQYWKATHEERIERVTGIDPKRESHVLLYGKAINGVDSPLSYDLTGTAMFRQERYPAEDRAIELCHSVSDSTERDATFWETGKQDLERMFRRKVDDRYSAREITHLSAFAQGPMPFLIRLGTLLTDIRDTDVYQLHREPKGWAWPGEKESIELKVERPTQFDGPPALVLALSATIEDGRIQRVLGEGAAIWRVTIPYPNQECIRSKADLAAFANLVRPLLNEIKARHGHDAALSIFPAAPVSTMVELGRLRQAKADMDWTIFDENRDLGGFSKAFTINNSVH